MVNRLLNAMRGKMLYYLLLVIFVQSLHPITVTNDPILVLVYQVFYTSLIAAGIIILRDQITNVRMLVGLALLWLITGAIYSFNQDAIAANLVAYVVIMIYQAIIIQIFLKFIFAAPTINADVIYAACAIYWLLGALFIPIYGITDTITYTQTGQNAFVDGIAPDPDGFFPWQTLIYYSYSTLTTLGYGEVLPVTSVARTFASLQTMIGVLYLTVIVARLVGVYAAQEIDEELDKVTIEKQKPPA